MLFPFFAGNPYLLILMSVNFPIDSTDVMAAEQVECRKDK